MIKSVCPYCTRNITIHDKDLEYHKKGRQAKCPECNKKFIMIRWVKKN